MPTTEELLAEILATAQDQLRWQRAAVLPSVRKTIDETLTSTQYRRAYEICDGTRTGAQVASAVGTTPQSVSNWTRRWRDVGIAYETDEGRIRHITSLESLGLPMESRSNPEAGAVAGADRRRGR